MQYFPNHISQKLTVARNPIFKSDSFKLGTSLLHPQVCSEVRGRIRVCDGWSPAAINPLLPQQPRSQHPKNYRGNRTAPATQHQPCSRVLLRANLLSIPRSPSLSSRALLVSPSNCRNEQWLTIMRPVPLTNRGIAGCTLQLLGEASFVSASEWQICIYNSSIQGRQTIYPNP